MKLDARQLQGLLEEQFQGAGDRFRVEAAEPGRVRVRLLFNPSLLRPGSAVAGPALMSLADTAMYMAVLSSQGPIVTVTSDLHIRFLRRAPPGDVVAECELLKVGSRLATGDVRLTDQEGNLVASASCSYALPR